MRHDSAIRYLAVAMQHLTTPDYAHSSAYVAGEFENERAHLREAAAKARYVSAYCARAIEAVNAREAKAKAAQAAQAHKRAQAEAPAVPLALSLSQETAALALSAGLGANAPEYPAP